MAIMAWQPLSANNGSSLSTNGRHNIGGSRKWQKIVVNDRNRISKRKKKKLQPEAKQ